MYAFCVYGVQKANGDRDSGSGNNNSDGDGDGDVERQHRRASCDPPGTIVNTGGSPLTFRERRRLAQRNSSDDGSASDQSSIGFGPTVPGAVRVPGPFGDVNDDSSGDLTHGMSTITTNHAESAHQSSSQAVLTTTPTVTIEATLVPVAEEDQAMSDRLREIEQREARIRERERQLGLLSGSYHSSDALALPTIPSTPPTVDDVTSSNSVRPDDIAAPADATQTSSSTDGNLVGAATMPIHSQPASTSSSELRQHCTSTQHDSSTTNFGDAINPVPAHVDTVDRTHVTTPTIPAALPFPPRSSSITSSIGAASTRSVSSGSPQTAKSTKPGHGHVKNSKSISSSASTASGSQKKSKGTKSGPGHVRNSSSNGSGFRFGRLFSIGRAVSAGSQRSLAAAVPDGHVPVWCWKETPSQMPKHTKIPNAVVGDKSDCWIRYTSTETLILEAAFCRGDTSCTPRNGYRIDFGPPTEQTKLSTGYKRDVQRIFEPVDKAQRRDSEPTISKDVLSDDNLVPSVRKGSNDDNAVAAGPTPSVAAASHPLSGTTNSSDLASPGVSTTSQNGSLSMTPTVPVDMIQIRNDDLKKHPSAKNKTIHLKTNSSVVWCWQETPVRLKRHSPENIISAEHCWIRYGSEASAILEEAFQSKKDKCVPMQGYTVDMRPGRKGGRPIQINDKTGWERNVARFVKSADESLNESGINS